MIKFACAGVFSSKLGPGTGYQYLCLDIGGQTRLLGMAKEETSALIAQADGLYRIDLARLAPPSAATMMGRTGHRSMLRVGPQPLALRHHCSAWSRVGWRA